MLPIIHALEKSEEYTQLRQLVEKNGCAAVSGMTAVVRAHYASALYTDLKRPLLLICRDEEDTRLMQEAVESFLGRVTISLPSRDFNFHDASAFSRGWEQKRLRIFAELLAENSFAQPPVLLASIQAMLSRTIPPEQLQHAAVTIGVGTVMEPLTLADKLVALGYSRCTMVEGPGQFAVRGGIVDVFTPSVDQPCRIEFFGDEVDTMGYFDLVSQRRTENVEGILLLPIAEVLPGLSPDGVTGVRSAMEKLLHKAERRKEVNNGILKTLRTDLERLENGTAFTAWDRYFSLIYPDFACAGDYLPENTIMLFCDHGTISQTAKGIEDDLNLAVQSLIEDGILEGSIARFLCRYEEFCGMFRDHPVVYLDSFTGSRYPESRLPKELFSVQSKQLPAYGGNLDTAISDLQHYEKAGYSVVVLCGSRHRGEVLEGMLREHDISCRLQIPLESIPQQGCIALTDGAVPTGIEYPVLSLAVLTEGQIAGNGEKKKHHRNPVKATNRQKLHSFTDLTPGDLVVHEYHGIGRYVAMEQIRMDGITKDYVKIAYSGTDVLYVPATQLDLISKYIGGGEDAPVKLNKLGTDTWVKTKARAKKAVQDMADDLIRLYAERKRLPGYAFSPDSPWQQEFEESFEYAETDDQLRCIEEIKEDMEQPQPMDRLLCGDVGFGKTEVALRAAMKAMLDGKQVAILVPTTVLAQQHYTTAMRRFRGFPVNIDVLSRFRTSAQQRNTLSRLAGGHIDLIIGTHKLLQKNVQFKDLGLLIVDEEQRFGVTHKERLKELAKGVDVLTLSATPIPRTLNMALSGIRDMSTIEEPPGDRYPVQTYVIEHADHVINDAIVRELERGGQVYYLHNRVETIEQTAAKLKRDIPYAEIAVAHGKMNEEELGDVMERMTEGEIQVLVCTTIIETGIDIPNVNTLIIEDADKLGLSQLHQIRGRVGRSSRHAYAYLTYRKGKVLTDVAEKRLTAIRDFAEFGSGFKIAMRDLEIRGAGNLLGAAQSGHMMSVGYDMYLQLLEDAVLEERGEAPARKPSCSADLTIEASISKKYVENGEQRMDLYRRIAAIRCKSDADDLTDELIDRYGDPPVGILNLIAVALLRAVAMNCGISDITQKSDTLQFTMEQLDFTAVSSLCTARDLKDRIRFAAGNQPIITYKLKKAEDPLKAADSFVRRYQSLMPAETVQSGSDGIR